jgi:sirohydrochlorin ferrochelatase
VQRGAQRVLLMPYFLSAGRHVVEHLQAFRDELAKAHPGVAFVLCPPLGLHPLMVQVVRDRLAEGAREKVSGTLGSVPDAGPTV